jgi:sarcosine oxidase gamma subunit
MADLAFCSIADQLGVTAADGFSVQETMQFLVSAPHDQAPNSVVAVDGGYACWLTPSRRLFVGAVPADGFVSDVSQGWAMFVVADHIDDLVAMGCPLPSGALAEGRCAQTLFAGLHVLLMRRAGLLHLHVERHLANHLVAWLRQALTAF